jgi:hypothetical protein
MFNPLLNGKAFVLLIESQAYNTNGGGGKCNQPWLRLPWLVLTSHHVNDKTTATMAGCGTSWHYFF